MPDPRIATLRRDAARLFDAGLAAVDGRARVAGELPRILPGDEPVHAAAIGKAATAMLRGAHDALGARLVAGLAVCADGYVTDTLDDLPACELLLGAHPVPDEASVRAGARLESFLGAQRARSRPLLLLSGGASSMVEAPRSGIDLAHIVRANRWLLGSGLPIDAVNRVRAALSRIKGGGLARLMPDGVALAISDVPGDIPVAIGSGPLHDATGALPDGLPDWLSALAASQPQRAIASAVPLHVVATAVDAIIAIACAARRMGYTVRHACRDLYGDVTSLAPVLAADAGVGCCVHAGEPTVHLPARPGQGGRCRHLALATALARPDYDYVLLAAGSDGRDGAGAAAGAIIDASTPARARALGFDPGAVLARADAGTLLEATGDALHCGPTGTNVADLIILLQHGHGS